MVPIRYRPDWHQVAEATPFSRFLQQHFNDPDIFTYFHKQTKNWLVAAWVDQKWGRMLELEFLGPGKHPVGTRKAVASIEEQIRGSAVHESNKRDLREYLSRMPKRHHQELQDDHDQEVERNQWVQRQLGNQLQPGCAY
jgi:hypothetical protein